MSKPSTLGGARPGAGRKPGTPRSPGTGRQKGTPNKRTQVVMDRIEASGRDVVGVLLDFLDHEDDKLRFDAAKELMTYMFPKLKAIEHTGKDGEPLAPKAHAIDVAERVMQLKGDAK